ncbi:maltoporin [Agarivorans gilvus]|nr:carbohydrate porin [Agarivorans gilvus]
MKLKTLAVAITAATISSSAFALDFNGYFRAGFGMNADGGSQFCYGNGGPDAHVVGRLGNECDTYAELSFSQNVVERPTGEKFSIHTLVAYGTYEEFGFAGTRDTRGNSFQGVTGEAPEAGAETAGSPWSGQRLSFREAYAKYIMSSGMELWAGNRYYGRKDVHINDWYYVNGSGYGVGVDNINVGLGQVAVAVRHTKWHDVSGGADMRQNMASTPILDLRWKGVDVGLGSLDFIAMLGKANLSDAQEEGATDGQYNDKTGFSGTIEWALGFSGGFNKLVAQYNTEGFAWSGYGMNNHLGDSYNIGNYNNGGDAQLGRKSWRIIDHGVASFGRSFDLGYSVFYSQLDNPGSDEKGKRFGATVRPRFKWNDTMSTQVEFGYYNQEDPWEPESTDLKKVTIAQAWSPLKEKGGFWARPEIRIFATHFFGSDKDNQWWDGAAGTENPEWGGYGTGVFDKSETMFGAQVEAWW